MAKLRVIGRDRKAADPNQLDWSRRRAKRHVDDLVSRIMLPWMRQRAEVGAPTRVLSFPAAEWIWELDFARLFSSNKLRFTGLEREPALWRKMKRFAEATPVRRGCRLVPCEMPADFGRWVSQDGFDFIYLDWMGSWSREKAWQVRHVFRHGLLSGDSLFRLTLAMSRGNSRLWEDLPASRKSVPLVDIRGKGAQPPDWRLGGVCGFVESAARERGYACETLAAHLYHSYGDVEGRPCPESSFLFQLRKR